MNGSAIAPGMLFASLGLALAFSASRRVLTLSLSGATAVAVATVAVSPTSAGPAPALTGCWISVLVAAACVYLPRQIGTRLALPICVNGSFWAGLTIAGAGEPLWLATSLPWLLLCVPGTWLVERGQAIVVRVGGSWLAAAAALSLGLNMVPTLGYEPDHRG